MSERPLVQMSNLVKEFPVTGGIFQRQIATVNAVAGVDLSINRGETVGLVGESGCGKSTLGRMLVRLLEPTSGTIVFDGEDITHIKGKKLKPFRRRAQIIFQDPYSSLDPRTQVGNSIAEGLKLHGVSNSDERQERVTKMLELVGLEGHHAGRFPHEFSGGPDLPEPSSLSQILSSLMSLCPLLTSRCRPRSSTFSRNCSRNST